MNTSATAPEREAGGFGEVVLEVEGLSKVFGSGQQAVTAIKSVSVAVREGEFVSIVGPSGCGKTTLLKCIAGLTRPTGGRSLLRGAQILEPPSDMAVVFQDYSRSLFPWLTVERNVALPLRKRRSSQTDAEVRASLEAVGLLPFRSSYPWQLSGGMQQRVAIARALAYRPKILLMDEPFASVDAQTRFELEDLVLRVRAKYGITILLVTHDIDEAVYMSDRIFVLGRRPSIVKEEIITRLPRPRNQVETKELPRFAQLRAQIYRSVLQEGQVVGLALEAPHGRGLDV